MAGPSKDAPSVDPSSRIWVTLITAPSYLGGLVLLVHSLYKHQSVHPIVIQYTTALSQDCVDVLNSLSAIYPLCHVLRVEPIALPAESETVASRFADTLTKLRVFEPLDDAETLESLGLVRTPTDICFLDADILILRNLDDIFTVPRPDSNWIAAHHVYVCNIDKDPWAPAEWNVDNCPSTPLTHPTGLSCPLPTAAAEGARSTYQLLNSGVFVCSPNREMWNRIEQFIKNDPRVKSFRFPDQNFLDVFFRDHWVPIGWQYNAIKTSRYWHPALWRDEEVRALHYIVDKPWTKRIGADGVAGYLGRDGVTHSWWWDEYSAWEEHMQSTGATNLLESVRKHVAAPLPT